MLNVKVRFCVDPNCLSPDDGDDRAPEVDYQFERAFYRGRYTTYEADIDAFPSSGIPAMPPPVGKCEIVGEGCWDGMTDNNCLSDGRHFCED